MAANDLSVANPVDAVAARVRARARKAEETKGFAIDEQTGKLFLLVPESRTDQIIAILSVIYLLGMLAFFFWLLISTWIGENRLMALLGYSDFKGHSPLFFRTMAYTAIGGALGGIVNGIRSFTVWHSERFAFGARFVWKYVTLPWLGVTLALFVYALILSGVAAFGGNFTAETTNTRNALFFGAGVLAGYGSNKVFIWLDDKVNSLFRVTPVAGVIVPELVGKTKEEAEAILKAANLKLGQVSEQVTTDTTKVGEVIAQEPGAGTSLDSGMQVAITLGKSA